MKGRRPYRAALRRGIGLGLAMVAIWGVSLTADLSALGEGLWKLGEEPSLAVGLLSGQMGKLPEEERALEGWGRLLLGQSALLAAGEEEVLQYRSGQQQPEDLLP